MYYLDTPIADEWGYESYAIAKYQLKEEVIAHSPNIIDVIDVGDYVNGCNVVGIKEDGVVVSGGFGEIWLSQIESVVTHESFNSIKYEVI